MHGSLKSDDARVFLFKQSESMLVMIIDDTSGWRELLQSSTDGY